MLSLSLEDDRARRAVAAGTVVLTETDYRTKPGEGLPPESFEQAINQYAQEGRPVKLFDSRRQAGVLTGATVKGSEIHVTVRPIFAGFLLTGRR